MNIPWTRVRAWILLLFLVSPWFEARATISVQIGQNFRGATLSVDSFSIPPDSDGAIGPNHFVQLVNGRFSVYDKTTGAKVLTKSDIAFWTSAGIDLTGLDVSDPRVIYDKLSQR